MPDKPISQDCRNRFWSRCRRELLLQEQVEPFCDVSVWFSIKGRDKFLGRGQTDVLGLKMARHRNLGDTKQIHEHLANPRIVSSHRRLRRPKNVARLAKRGQSDHSLVRWRSIIRGETTGWQENEGSECAALVLPSKTKGRAIRPAFLP